MKLSPGSAVLVAALMLAAPCQAQEAPADPQDAQLHAALDAAAPGWLAQYDVPSLAVAYIREGALVWTAAYGMQSPDTPATVDTLYNIASMTKPLTAETTLRLIAAGRMSLDDPLSAYWVDPDIADNAWTDLLTPEIVLSHRTGFTNWRYQTDGVLQFQWEPGTSTGYSGEGMDYLARYLEARFDAPFNQIVREELFTPLGMDETSFVRPAGMDERIALPYGPEGEFGEPDFSDPWSAADNVYTTIGDYAKFFIAAIRHEGLDDALAASRVTIRDNLIATGCPLAPEMCPSAVGFGLGWEVFEYGDDRIVDHGGSDRGERTMGWFDPDTGTGAIIFTNGANGNGVIRDVARLLGTREEYVAFLTLQAGGD